MTTLSICLVAFIASALTFFSGFGLGTLLLPAFALFYPIEVAVASTAVVHFLNGVFKLGLVGRYADRRIVLRFGLPAIGAAFLGAGLLLRLAHLRPVASYTVGGLTAVILPVKLVVGVLLLLVTVVEMVPRFQSVAFPVKYVPLGGVLSGFFGGLSGMQGAFRSAFLIRVGLSKEAFIGTGVVVATLVDLSRLGVYGRNLIAHQNDLSYALLGAAVAAAITGAVVGNRFLQRLTVKTLQLTVGITMGVVAVCLAAGVL